MTADQPPLTVQQAIDQAIRPVMLVGLQDSDLSGPAGAQRIGEWADWIAATAAEAALRAAGIDGTAGDAQDIRHRFVRDDRTGDPR